MCAATSKPRPSNCSPLQAGNVEQRASGCITVGINGFAFALRPLPTPIVCFVFLNVEATAEQRAFAVQIPNFWRQTQASRAVRQRGDPNYLWSLDFIFQRDDGCCFNQIGNPLRNARKRCGQRSSMIWTQRGQLRGALCKALHEARVDVCDSSLTQHQRRPVFEHKKAQLRRWMSPCDFISGCRRRRRPHASSVPFCLPFP